MRESPGLFSSSSSSEIEEGICSISTVKPCFSKLWLDLQLLTHDTMNEWGSSIHYSLILMYRDICIVYMHAYTVLRVMHEYIWLYVFWYKVCKSYDI